MRNINQWSIFSLGICVAAGLTMGGYFVGQTLYNAKVAVNTAEAKGLSEKRVTADKANWEINFSVKGPTRDDVPNLYKKAEIQQAEIIKLLIESGFKEKNIKADVLNYSSKEIRDTKKVLIKETHTLSGSIRLETQQVNLVEKSRAKINKLIAKGYDIDNNMPEYHFTKLNEIKPDMLKEATKNARLSAKQFAEDAGAKVGSIRTARQGNFSIKDIGSSYYSTRRLEKEVRVVTTITFYLNE